MAEEGEVAELVVGYDSSMYNTGFPGDDALRAVPSDARHDGWYGPEGLKNLASHSLQRTQGCASRTSRFGQERMTRIMFCDVQRASCVGGDPGCPS